MGERNNIKKKTKYINIIKKLNVFIILLVLTLNNIIFATGVAGNDGSAFITKSEFDALKSNFQSKIDQYNTSIDSKIDSAIASYLAGIHFKSEFELENLYANIEPEVKGAKILWSSKTTCDYNKFKYTNLGYKLDIRERRLYPGTDAVNRVTNYGINHSGLLFDWPVSNIVTYGGGYQMTDSKTSINLIGDEICFNKYSQPLSGYAGYYPQSSGDGRYIGVGSVVKSIGGPFNLCTTFSVTMMWIYDVTCEVVTSSSAYYLLEPNNSETIYTFDSKIGYKTFSWPAYFAQTAQTTDVRQGLSRSASNTSTDLSVNDKWKDQATNGVQTRHYGTDSDFDYATKGARMYAWSLTTGYYPWLDTSFYSNTVTYTSLSTTYHPGAVFFTNYGEHSAVNDLVIQAPRDKYGIYSKVSEGMPVLKLRKAGTFEFKVKSNASGQLVVSNIGAGEATHTATHVTTVSLTGGAASQTITADAELNDVIVVKFLPTSTSTNASLTITDTKEKAEQ